MTDDRDDVDAPTPAAPDDQQPDRPLPSQPPGDSTPPLSAEPAATAPGPETSATPGPDVFRSGEKVRELLRLAFESPPANVDRRTAAALRAVATARRFRLLAPIVDVFPSLEDHGEWDAWLSLAVGVALNLVSDDVELDVDACRHAGAQVLAQLFEEAEAGRA